MLDAVIVRDNLQARSQGSLARRSAAADTAKRLPACLMLCLMLYFICGKHGPYSTTTHKPTESFAKCTLSILCRV